MFFDNASTTKIDDEIINNFKKLNDDNFYNPGALYSLGRKSKKILDSYREEILKILNGDSEDNIVFTGSATEANNLALRGSVRKNIGKILVSKGEHPCVYNTAKELKDIGFDVEFINLDKFGKVDFDDFKRLMTKDVGFVSIMHVSNETGAINDIHYLCDYAKSINPRVVFHSDGVQAVGKIDVDLEYLNVDMYTMSAHKIHGMKGVGALYIKKGIKLKPLIFGGGQENGLRSGTENIIGVYSLVEGLKIATSKIKENFEHILNLKNKFLKNLESSNLNFVLNSFTDNSPYIISIGFVGCRAETLLNILDDRGVMVGNGSACSSKNSGNRILESMGCSKDNIRGNLRISFSKYNTLEEVDNMSKILIESVNKYLSKV